LTPDWRVFAYTAALSVLTGIAVGLWPAIQAARTDLCSTLKQEATGKARAGRSRNMLLGAQVAACLILLAGAGLLFRGVRRLGTADAGFDTKHVFLMGVNAKPIAATPSARTALLHRVIDRVQALPEVASIAWVDRPPFIRHGSGPFRNEQGTSDNCLFNGVSDRYFETLGLKVLRGRVFAQDQ